MTIRSSDEAYQRALAALTREASEVPVPELDWERIEAKVLSRAIAPENNAAPRAAGVRSAPTPSTWASTPWPMAVAAAAAAALICAGPSSPHRAPARAEEARTAAPHGSPVANLSSLEVGEVAETDVRTAVYDRPGVVHFALAPNSRIEV